MKDLRDSLTNGEILLGSFIMSGSPVNIELSGYLGYDFVVIDCEHGSVSPYGMEMENLIRASYAANISPLVRVIENNMSQIRKALDFGAKGIVVPFINTKEDAKRLVDACLFPSEGNRGRCPIVRAARFGVTGWSDFVERSNEDLIIMPIIEKMEGVENLEEILSVKGINSILFGPFDLAVELGIKPKVGAAGSETLTMVSDPVINKHMEYIISTCKKRNVPLANVAWSIESAIEMVEMGCQIIAFTDTSLFVEIAKKYIDSVRSKLKRAEKK